MFTSADFDRMTRNDAWLGFGYLGERRNYAEGHADEVGRAVLATADNEALEVANNLGLTEEELFYWANPKNGRWFGDCMFGNGGRHMDRYLPGQPQR